MFRIGQIHDDVLPVNREAIRQVQEILRAQFPLLQGQDITKIPDSLRNPLKYRQVLSAAVKALKRFDPWFSSSPSVLIPEGGILQAPGLFGPETLKQTEE